MCSGPWLPATELQAGDGEGADFLSFLCEIWQRIRGLPRVLQSLCSGAVIRSGDASKPSVNPSKPTQCHFYYMDSMVINLETL